MTGRDWRQRWLGDQPVAPVYGITLVASRAKCKYKVCSAGRDVRLGLGLGHEAVCGAAAVPGLANEKLSHFPMVQG